MHALILAILFAVAPQQGLDELHALCARDGGRLWGVPLCGPTMIVDRKTRAITADRPAPAVLPKEVGIANTAVDFEGQRWTMIAGPLPDDPFARKMLLAHESFHRVQDSLGFPSAGPANAHGTVYPTLTARDDWGSLEVRRGGALISGDWTRLTVPTLSDDYTLTLSEGWTVENGVVVRKR